MADDSTIKGRPRPRLRCAVCGIDDTRTKIFTDIRYFRRWILFGPKVRVVTHTCSDCDFL